jgi:hypothetical protein
MNIEGLGKLERYPDIDEWLVSKPIAIPYMSGNQFQFVIEDIEYDSNKEEYISAIRNFLSLEAKERDGASNYVFQQYKRFCELVDEDDVMVYIEDPEDVWAHVQPSEIHVSRRPRGDEGIYVQLLAECDWEVEHGLQLVFRNGNELSRVSEQDGHLTHSDAYALPESEDRIC